MTFSVNVRKQNGLLTIKNFRNQLDKELLINKSLISIKTKHYMSAKKNVFRWLAIQDTISEAFRLVS